ncbi:Sex comb on midleg-like protein 2 [Galemys pyrenaicus]|uniref:Sex comb on midleg-like protein 2 n=1 Tax=Galemys pyrenaicus TaxID=202257 RepID=A0A8J5ZU97_GALPY|nr:Sex comb on midleg-like protein 2 [Galemys pyrenaicus]
MEQAGLRPLLCQLDKGGEELPEQARQEGEPDQPAVDDVCLGFHGKRICLLVQRGKQHSTRSSTHAFPALFAILLGSAKSPLNNFKVGVKLEAIDRKNLYLICLATLRDVKGDEVNTTWDGWRELLITENCCSINTADQEIRLAESSVPKKRISVENPTPRKKGTPSGRKEKPFSAFGPTSAASLEVDVHSLRPYNKAGTVTLAWIRRKSSSCLTVGPCRSVWIVPFKARLDSLRNPGHCGGEVLTATCDGETIQPPPVNSESFAFCFLETCATTSRQSYEHSYCSLREFSPQHARHLEFSTSGDCIIYQESSFPNTWELSVQVVVQFRGLNLLELMCYWGCVTRVPKIAAQVSRISKGSAHIQPPKYGHPHRL